MAALTFDDLDTQAETAAPAPRAAPSGPLTFDDLAPAAAAAAAPAQPSQWDLFKAGLSAIAQDPRKLLGVGPLRGVEAGAELTGRAIKGTLPSLPTGYTQEEGLKVADMASLITPGVPARLTTQGLVGIPRAVQKSWLFRDTVPAAPDALSQLAFPKGVNPAAANEAAAAEFGIPLTRGQATGSFAQQQAESMMARGGGETPQGQTMRNFLREQEEAIATAKGDVGAQLGGGQSLVERPYDAAAQVAERARATHQLAETVAQGQEAAVTAARSRLNPLDPVDAASAAAQAVREQAAAQRTQFKQSYEEAGKVPGAFEPGAFQNVGQSVVNRINNSDRPIPIDPVLTPSAHRAVTDLQQMPRVADPEGIGPSMGDVEQFRKRLVFSRGATTANATDRAAMDQVIHHFDNHVEDALTGGLFNGSDRALDLYRQARAQFSQYRQTFHPRGAGDDVGRAMQLIVDRNAQPQEVANLLYGTGVAGNTGKALRLADRLQKVLPEPLWQQTQQGYIGRVMGSGGDHAQVVANIQKALSGEGRGLTYRILSDQQVGGLRSIQRGLQAASGAREAVPGWIQQLGKADFEPQAVAQSLFGKSTLTGTTASIGYAKGVRDLVGPQSDTWAGVRQAGWQQLVNKPEGATADFGPQALANRIVNFLEKDGRGLANILYTAEERETMRRFAGVMRTLTPQRIAGGSASPNSDTAPALMATLKTLSRHQSKIAMLLGAAGFVKGGPAGAAAGYGIAKGLDAAASRMAARDAARRAEEAVSGAPTMTMPPLPDVPRAPAPLDLPPWLLELIPRATAGSLRSATEPLR